MDPDKLELSKTEVLLFCDRVIKKWSNDPSKNAQHLLAMNAVRTSVVWTDEDTLKAVWGEITQWLYELMYENAMAGAAKNGEKWPGTLKSARSKRSR